MFSACDPATTCTGKEKECKGGVCKCKNGFKEDPVIENPSGKDACVPKDEGRKNCIVSERIFLFHCVWRIEIMVDCSRGNTHIFRTRNTLGFDF